MRNKLLVIAILGIWAYAMYQLAFYVILHENIPSCIEKIYGEQNVRKEVALDIMISNDCELQFIIINNQEVMYAERTDI